MVPIEKLGRALAVLREKHRKTQEEVATAASVTASMISNYERGKEKPSLESLWKILTAMNCTLIDLEASLRLVNGEAFPLHCQNWSISIHSEDFAIGAKTRPKPDAKEAKFSLAEVLAQTPSLSQDAERHLASMVYNMMAVMQMGNLDPFQSEAEERR
ncbi:MAG: helix-turn-helix transcriptional regulator [Acidobacteriota bacterium]